MLDDEAEVIAHERGAGRHQGRCGAVRVRLRNGKEFKIGTGFSDQQRDNPPEIGTIVTFRYQVCPSHSFDSPKEIMFTTTFRYA
jgi:DNA ligase-1